MNEMDVGGHLPNLEARGEISPISFAKSRSVKFYALADIRRLQRCAAKAVR